MMLPINRTLPETSGNFSSANFAEQLAYECIQGSAINPRLFQAAIEVVTDLEIGSDREATYPSMKLSIGT